MINAEARGSSPRVNPGHPPPGGLMKRLNVVEPRHSLADILNRAEYQGERSMTHKKLQGVRRP